MKGIGKKQKPETTLETILAMARVRKTGWHHGERQNEPTKTWGRTKTLYWLTHKGIRYRWRVVGKGKVRERNRKALERGKITQREDLKSVTKFDTWGQSFTIKQETWELQKTGSWQNANDYVMINGCKFLRKGQMQKLMNYKKYIFI